MKKQNERSTAILAKKSDTQKLSYSSPKVTYVPQKIEEKANGEAKKGTWAVPIGCC